MNTRYVQTASEYGYSGPVTLADYAAINPAGRFFQSYDGIYEEKPITREILPYGDDSETIEIEGEDYAIVRWERVRVATPVLDAEWAPSYIESVSESAEWYGVPADTLRAAIRRGALDGRKSGRVWLVHREDVRQYLRRTNGLN